MAFTVNGELVEDSVIRAEIKALRPHYEAAAHGLDPIAAEAQLREWSRENVIERVLLRQEAAADPEPVPADATDETRIRVDRLLAKITSRVSPPKHKEITEYYRKNKERFYRLEQVRAAHIFQPVNETTDETTAHAAIQQTHQQLAEGAKIENLPGYGDLGYVARGQMARQFDDLLFSLAENQMSDIFRSPGGFHILKVYERKPAGISDYEEVREALTAALYQQKKERAIENFLDRLKAKAVVLELHRSA
jgi:parvulin-like peptidyl-prolyl isomerase